MKVLFICKGNWLRSQMAAVIYNHLTRSNDAFSAGTYVGAPDEPEGQVLSDLFHTSALFDFMNVHGMNIKNNRTKKLLPEMLGEADIVVSMAEEPFVPEFLKNNTKVIRWNIKNPDCENKGICETKEIIENIYNQLLALIQELLIKYKI